MIHDQVARGDRLIMSSSALFAQGILLEAFKVPLKVGLFVLIKLSLVDAHAIRILYIGYYLRN